MYTRNIFVVVSVVFFIAVLIQFILWIWQNIHMKYSCLHHHRLCQHFLTSILFNPQLLVLFHRLTCLVTVETSYQQSNWNKNRLTVVAVLGHKSLSHMSLPHMSLPHMSLSQLSLWTLVPIDNKMPTCPYGHMSLWTLVPTVN